MMKSYSLSFKQESMLCHRCLMNVVKTLSSLQELVGVDVNLESKKIKVIYKGKEISREDIKDIVNRSILSGKVVKLEHSL